jgi:hypothetical protein
VGGGDLRTEKGRTIAMDSRKTLLLAVALTLILVPQIAAGAGCPPGTKPVPETDNCVPVAQKGAKCGKGQIKIDGACVLKQDAATHCGPGYHLEGHHCVQGYREPTAQKQMPSWMVEGMKHGCKKGMAWNAQEGCHEND